MFFKNMSIFSSAKQDARFLSKRPCCVSSQVSFHNPLVMPL
ncbi:hypothetical protein HMPREF1991_02343 [Hoylesella loescheii DSM 19665 = JCM 12249 = ATCC 15930]|uniref:Uncharacterized protein n=1 Tax=Hoylesella loescheii DSM 19665 = JCM 12249 = ATCC 15930 TaxID=1122985 RepID=A0A069QP60_HOYLO|nr:hypothetical protein HMPREF1991_02343 [Hoylesella loescheii DSM 19665 = JCM 12249 = ATCC 15930]